jgi:hypothetical protein
VTAASNENVGGFDVAVNNAFRLGNLDLMIAA